MSNFELASLVPSGEAEVWYSTKLQKEKKPWHYLTSALSMIERFVATVGIWQRILSDYHPAPPVVEPGKIPDLPYPPPGEFLQL